MFDPKKAIKDLIDSGLSEEEACKEVRKEIKKRNIMSQEQVKFINDDTFWFRDRCDRFKR